MNVLVASACISVIKQDAQVAKIALLKGGLLDPEREPHHEGNRVYFPVPDGAETSVARAVTCPYEHCTGKCPVSRKKRPGSLAERLSGAVPGDLAGKVPRAFNIVGTIAVIEIDDQLLSHANAITEAICEIYPHVTSIFSKRSERSGEFRTSHLDLLWGNDDPVTTQVENGCRFRVDVREAFFDPRLVHEHARVIESIKAECKATGTRDVLDLFCGVGPFIVPLAKHPCIRVFGIDLNLRAIQLLHANVMTNHVDPSRVHGYKMDARSFLEAIEIDGRALPRDYDAIILNLPRTAHEFLAACKPRCKAGTRLFWYTIAREFFDGKERPGDEPDAIRERLQGLARADDVNPVSEICMAGLDVVKSLGLRIDRITRVKPFSPYKYTYCFELEA